MFVERIKFVELHLLDNNEKVMLNINRINSIYQINGKVTIYDEEVVYRVKESYEEVVALINNCIGRNDDEIKKYNN